MQNILLAVLHWTLRLLRFCLTQMKSNLLMPQSAISSTGLLAIGVSVDLDSARLDAVSRSMLWGPGAWPSEKNATAVCWTTAACRTAAEDGAVRRRRRFDD